MQKPSNATFGGTDGHKYVNGVRDKLAATMRPVETREVRTRAAS